MCIDDLETDLKAFEVYTVKEVFQTRVSLEEIESNSLFNGFASKRFISFNLSRVDLYKAKNNRNQSTNVLTWDLVEEIRNKDFKRLNYKEIGEIYGVSRNVISNCLNNRTWNKKL